MLVTVERAEHHESFPGEFSDDEPSPGNVYYAFFVAYEGLAAGGNYNPFDWQAFAGDKAVQQAFVLNAPEPDLSSGSLPAGRTAEGWLVYEGPADPEKSRSATRGRSSTKIRYSKSPFPAASRRQALTRFRLKARI